MIEKSPDSTKVNKSTEVKEDTINLMDLWQVIWKRKKFIGALVVIVVLATVVISLFMTDIYQSSAVIIPVTNKDTGSGTSALSVVAQQFGSLPGISMPGSTSSTEIVSLLNSNILREKIIERYGLMPILFHEQWDSRKRDWKRESKIDLNPSHWLSKLADAVRRDNPKASQKKKDENAPSLWDGLRFLDGIVRIDNDVKNNTITLTVDYENPELAAKLAGYFLEALTEHMSAEAKRVALINRTYLEEQLNKTADPLIRQKIYNLIAQQVETAMMSEVKENFAFKVIDPPKVPDRKIKPRRALMVVLSFVAALFMGVFTAFFMEYLERVRISSQGEESETMRGDRQ